MALLKTKAPTPVFEDETATEQVAAAAPVAEAPPAAKALVTAPAKPPAMTPTGQKFRNIAPELEKAMPPMPYGALPALKSKAGELIDETGQKAGTFVNMQVMSFNYKWVVSPGAEGSEAAKFLRTSYDGETIDSDGSNLKEYLAQLKIDGYPNAKIGRRVDVIGILESAAKGTYEKVGSMVTIDLAPTSVARFQGQLAQSSVALSNGRCTEEDSRRMKFSTISKSSGGVTWSGVDITAADPA